MDLKTFNVFGFVRVEPTLVQVMATGVLEGDRSIEKVVKKTIDEPIYDVSAWPEPVVILFAANVNAAGKIKIVTQSFMARAGGPDIAGHKVVREALKEATNQFR